MAHYETVYGPETDFATRNARNHEEIKRHYIPAILKSGLSVNLKVDVDPIELSDHDKEDYPNPNDFTSYSGIRSPDITVIDDRIRIVGAEGLAEAYMEVKDYPRLSYYRETGCESRLVMRYLAIQHLCRKPVVMLFKDHDRKENGKFAEQKAAFDGEPYGGLIWDLVVSTKSFRIPHVKRHPNGSEDKFAQILWHLDRPDGTPLMKPVSEIAEELRSGRVSMRAVDPSDHPLWSMLGNKELWKGWPKPKEFMRPPKGGLVVFTSGTPLLARG